MPMVPREVGLPVDVDGGDGGEAVGEDGAGQGCQGGRLGEIECIGWVEYCDGFGIAR